MRQSRYYKGPVSDHFDGRRFYGPDRSPPKTLIDMLRWSFTSRRARWPKHVNNLPADPVVQRVTEGLRATIIGHSAILLQMNGVNILTDPVWSPRASPTQLFGPKRARAPGLPLDALPTVDLVLVTHNHYDHLDTDTLRELVRRFNPLILTPLGNDTVIRKAVPQARITALDWDQSVELDGLRIEAEPVQHWSSRWLGDRNEALWAGFTISGSRRVFVTGDTGFGAGWWARRAQAKHHGFDLAVIPIGAYAPRWFMKDSHMNPDEAAQTFNLLQSKKALACHHGTFQLTDEAMDEPARLLQQALADHKIPADDFRVLQPGEGWDLA